MNCDKFSEMLLDYLDDTLSNEEKIQMDMHLQSCVVCKEEMELVRENMNLLHDLPMVELPDGYHEELMAKLSSEAKIIPITAHKAKKATNRWKQYSLVAAAALIVVASGGINGILSNREPIDQMVRGTPTDGVVLDTPVTESDDVESGVLESQVNAMSAPAQDAGAIEEKQTVSNNTANNSDLGTARMLEPQESKDDKSNDTYADENKSAVTAQGNADVIMPYHEMPAEARLADDMGSSIESTMEETIEDSVAMGAYDVGVRSLPNGAVMMKSVVSEEAVASDQAGNAWDEDIETQKNDAVISHIHAIGGNVVFMASDGEKTTAIIPEHQLDTLVSALKEIATVKTIETNEEEMTVEITLK